MRCNNTAFTTMLMVSTVSLLASIVGVVWAGDRYHPYQERAARAPAVPPAEFTREHWEQDAQAAIRARQRPGNAGSGGKARNVVLFLGDGMSIPTLAAARALLGQRNNKTGEESQLSFEAFPTVGLSKTYCVNAQVADSACSATAYLCGVKANSGTLGVTAAVNRRDCPASTAQAVQLDSIAAWALADGRDAGIVTTTRITHASPAGTYANAANRNWENDADVSADSQNPELCRDIAYQLVHTEPGKNFKVIFGGGRRNFLPVGSVDEEGTAGRRTDNRSLIEDWKVDKANRNLSYQYVWNKEQLLSANSELPEYMLGLFEGNHLQYNLIANKTTEPTLAELTETAIKMLSRNEKGFFLFVEGGRIDHAHHDNLVELALDETLELHSAVAKAAELLSEEDSLLVVTADHAHVMAYNGYSPRGRPILGPSNDRDVHNKPYMTLSYPNGPGFRPHEEGIRPDVTQESNFDTTAWRSHVDVPLGSETHGGDDVAVFARGPHHEMFAGMYEQSHLPHRMAYAGCFGRGLQACNSGPVLEPLILTILAALFAAFKFAP